MRKQHKKYYGQRRRIPGVGHYAGGLIKDGLMEGLSTGAGDLISYYYEYFLYKYREYRERKNQQEAQEQC